MNIELTVTRNIPTPRPPFAYLIDWDTGQPGEGGDREAPVLLEGLVGLPMWNGKGEGDKRGAGEQRKHVVVVVVVMSDNSGCIRHLTAH